MILGCHREDDVNFHRADEVEAAWGRMVDAAYGIGLDEAFRKSHPENLQMSDETLRRNFMVPWFLNDFVLDRKPEYARPLFADHVDRLDLTSVREAAAVAKRFQEEVLAERAVLRRRDLWHLDDEHMDSAEPAGLENTVVRHADGRPRPVFHVTPNEFDRFLSISHFGSALSVSRHAYNMIMQAPYEHFDVHACWLDIRNPIVIEDKGTMASTWLISQAHDAGFLDLEEMRWITGHPDPLGLNEDANVEAHGHPRRLMLDNLAMVLLSKGYDGIRYDNAIEGGGSSWVNLRSDQVIVDRVMRFAAGNGEFVPIEPAGMAFGA